VRCFNVVARARGEGGGLSRENAWEEIRPRYCHGERQVWRANEGRANEVLLYMYLLLMLIK